MNKLKFLSFLAFAVVIALPGCKDDDDPATNEITITIEEPMDGENIGFAECDSIHLHIAVEASIENHEVEVFLYTVGITNDTIIDYDLHDHDKIIMFRQDLDLCSYGAGTCFHLEVQACVDHDCGEVKTAEVEFCIQ